MRTLQFYNSDINERNIEQAARALENGEIIIVPTDSLYAFVCNALNQRAIERLCQIKGLNPEKNLLSVICSDFAQAAQYARIDNHAFRVMNCHLPGPFTFILPASNKLPKAFKNRKTVGIRIPHEPVLNALSQSLDFPLMATSVDEELTEPGQIEVQLGDSATFLLDDGTRAQGHSAIIDLSDPTDPQIIRTGPIDF